MTLRIYHNPNCSKSRATLELIRARGLEPEVIDYHKTGWSLENLSALLHAAGLPPSQALRKSEARDLGIDTEDETAILSAMLAHPQLVERPFVQGPKGTALCRPPERVLALL